MNNIVLYINIGLMIKINVYTILIQIHAILESLTLRISLDYVLKIFQKECSNEPFRYECIPVIAVPSGNVFCFIFNKKQ